MKTIRYLATGLLLFTGLLHVIQIFTTTVIDAAILITVTFGVIYLVLGFLLLRSGRVALWLAAILPLVGLLLALVGMLTNPTMLGALFIVTDIAIAACCFTLLFSNGQKELSV
jgi:hypothetical protein